MEELNTLCYSGKNLKRRNLFHNGKPLMKKYNKHNFNYAGFEVLTEVDMNSSFFWDITPCSPLKFSRRFGRICRLHFQGLAYCMAYLSTIKIEMACSSETSDDFNRTTRRYIPG
jgi:hypothetical protein